MEQIHEKEILYVLKEIEGQIDLKQLGLAEIKALVLRKHIIYMIVLKHIGIFLMRVENGQTIFIQII